LTKDIANGKRIRHFELVDYGYCNVRHILHVVLFDSEIAFVKVKHIRQVVLFDSEIAYI
jgi:hypothetical protein